MIQAKELRIGNLIYLGDRKETTRVVSINFDRTVGFVVNNTPYDFYSPIPLTPELLEKCGFVKEGERHYDHKGFANIYNICGIGLYYWEGEIIFQQCTDNGYSSGLEIPVKYLHTLQNLYYSISGQELNIEL